MEYGAWGFFFGVLWETGRPSLLLTMKFLHLHDYHKQMLHRSC